MNDVQVWKVMSSATSDAHLLEVTASAAAANTARQFAVQAAREWETPDQVCEVIELVVSELVSNGVQHGAGPTVAVRVARDDLGVAIEVVSTRSPTERIQFPATEALPGPEAPSGRGLALVRRFAPDLDLTVEPQLVTARCTVSYATVPSPEG
jgi:anti-sigma regulatory factor (Ser/Thr protein kinase)